MGLFDKWLGKESAPKASDQAAESLSEFQDGFWNRIVDERVLALFFEFFHDPNSSFVYVFLLLLFLEEPEFFF